MRLTEIENKGMNGHPIYTGSYGNVCNLGDNRCTSMVHCELGHIEDILENHNIETLEQLDDLLSYVKQIKDIENELGIDFITYVKIMQDGFYGMCEDEYHTEPYVFFFEPQDIELDTESKELIVWWECTAHDCNEENVYTRYKLKDQGKTWALTKEGLENE